MFSGTGRSAFGGGLLSDLDLGGHFQLRQETSHEIGHVGFQAQVLFCAGAQAIEGECASFDGHFESYFGASAAIHQHEGGLQPSGLGADV